MARFTETVNIGPAQSFQADASSLVNRLEAFSQQQLRTHAQQVSERSLAEGQAALVEGEKPQFKEEKFFGSVAAKSYNKGLRAAYLASIDRDSREEVARIASENSTDLTKFNDQVETYRKSLISSVDPAARTMAADSLDSLISANRIRVQSNEIEKTHKENALEVSNAVEAATSDALGFARDGNDQAAAESALVAFAGIQGAVDAGFLSDEQGADQRRAVERGMVEEKLKGDVFGTFNESGARAAYDQLDDLSDKRQKGFSPEEWDSFIGKTQTELNRKNQRQKIDLKAHAKEVKLNESIDRGQKFTDPGHPADPAKSSQDRKDVNNYYNSIEQDWSGDPNQVIERNVEFVKNTGIVPDLLVSNMNAVMRSGSDEQAMVHMELMQRIQTDAPNALKDFPDESRAIALQVSDSINNGQEIDIAVESARKNTYGLTETQKEEIRLASSTKKAKKARVEKFEELIKDEFDPLTFPIIGMLRGAPEAPPGMQAAYMSNFEDFMAITNGNIEQSEKLAFESTKNVWGVTKIGPRRFMQYPPESFYSVDGFNDSWINDQFLEDAEGLGIEDPIIGVDDMVSRSSSPSYPMLSRNDEGFLDVVEDENGKPLRFRPDFKLTEEYRELSDAPGLAIEKAKERREKNIVRRANVLRRRIKADVFHMSGILSSKAKDEHLKTPEGKRDVLTSVNNMIASGDLDQVEAQEVLAGFNAGEITDLPAYDIFVRSGKVDANN